MKLPRTPSTGELLFAQHCLALRLPSPTLEHRFSTERKWRFDFAWPELKIAVEIEGVTKGKPGHHQRADGVAHDCQKYNAALDAGWRVYRFTPSMVRSGNAVTVVEQALLRAQEAR